MKADILRLLAKGDRNKFTISNMEGIYSNTVGELLADLKKHDLVSEFKGQWSLQKRGKNLIRALERIERLLG
jgi:predicted transcriptional regulator